MATILAHRIRLYPNNFQATYFSKACGVSRFAYNWALAEWRRLYAEGVKVSEAELRKKLNAIKRESFPWMLEVTKCAPQLAIKDLGVAWVNFFEGRAEAPQFKKKGQRDSFRISNDQFAIKGEKIRIPNLGWVRLAEALRFEGKILGATVSKEANSWYVSVQVEKADPPPLYGEANEESDGKQASVDLEEAIEGRVKPYKALLSRMRRLSRSLSRKVGARRRETRSKGYIKTRQELIRLHARVANIRGDALHKLTTELTREYGRILVAPGKPRPERRREIPRSMQDVSFSEFRRQLEYKAKLTGSYVAIIQGHPGASGRTCKDDHPGASRHPSTEGNKSQRSARF